MTTQPQNLYYHLRSWIPPATALAASDLHGLLCGLFCAGKINCYLLWKQELISMGVPSSACSNESESILKTIYWETYNQLCKEGFYFQILLPDDSEPIKLRANSLAQWCQGLFLGLSVAGSTDFSGYSQDAQQIIADLSKFCQIDQMAGLDEESEENEQAYTELVEYTRIGVLTIFEENKGVLRQPPE